MHLQASLSPGLIAEKLAQFMNAPDTLAGMAAAARRVGRPDAAQLLADLVEAIAAGRPIAEFKESL